MHKVVFKLCLNLKANMIFHKDEKDMLLNKTSTLASFKKCITLLPRHQKLFYFESKLFWPNEKQRVIIRISSSPICSECKEFFSCNILKIFDLHLIFYNQCDIKIGIWIIIGLFKNPLNFAVFMFYFYFLNVQYFHKFIIHKA